MAVNTWSSAGSTDGSLGSNWSLGSLSSTDTLTFDNTSDIDCIFTGAVDCAAIDANTGYDGHFDQGGQTITCSGSANFDHDGDLTLDAAFTIDADGDFHVATSVGTFLAAGCTLDLQGTGNLDVDEDHTASIFTSLTCAASSKVTTLTGAETFRMASLVLGAGEASISLGTTKAMSVEMVAASTLSFNASHTITGTNRLFIRAEEAMTKTIPLINASGNTGGIYIYNNSSGTVTFTLGGTIAVNGNVRLFKGSTGTTTIDLDTYDLSCVGLSYGNNNATGNFTLNMGSGAFYTGTGLEGTTYNLGATSLNFETATCTIDKNLIIGSNATVDAGTSTITLTADNNGACAITSAGESFYDVVINDGAGTDTFTLQDAFSCDTLVVTNGNFDQNGQTITSVSDILFDGAGDITLDAAVTMTGDGDFHVGSTIGTFTHTSLALDLQGTGNLDIDKEHTARIASLICSANTKTTTHTGDVPFYTKKLTLGAGTLTCNTSESFNVNCEVADALSFNASHTINGGACDFKITTIANAFTLLVPQINASGLTGGRVLIDSDSGLANGFTLQGNITTGGDLRFTKGNRNGAVTTDCGTYDLTVTDDLIIGNQKAINNHSFLLGSGTHSVGGSIDFASINTGVTVANLESASITVGNDAVIGSNTTLNGGTSTLTLTASADATCDITSDGESFYDIVINDGAGTDTFTLQDALSCDSLTVTNGNFDQNGQQIITQTGFSVDGTGDLTLDATVFVAQDGDFHIGSTIGTFTYTSATVDMQGTGNFDVDKAHANGFAAIKTAGSGKTVTTTGSVNPTCTTLTLRAGTLDIGSNYGMIIKCSAADALTFNASHALTSSELGGFFIYLDTNVALSIPQVNAAGMTNVFGLICNTNTDGGGYTLAGDVTCGGVFGCYGNTGALGDFTFDADTFAITAGGEIRLDSRNGASSATFDMGSGAHSTATLFNTSSYEDGPITVNLETCTLSVGDDLAIGSNTTLDAGTSTLTLTASSDGTCDITSDGESFYDIVINDGDGADTFTLIDALSCDTLTVTNGNFDQNGQTITSVSDMTFNGAGSITLDSTVTMTGDGNFTCGATDPQFEGSTIDLQGTGDYRMNVQEISLLPTLQCAASGKTTTITGSQNTFVHYLTLGAGTLTLSKSLTVYAEDANALSFNASHTINGTQPIGFYVRGAITLIVPQVNASGLANSIDLLCNTGSTCGINVTGNIVGGADIGFLRANNAGVCTFDVNTHNLTAATNLLIGNANANNSITINMGSGTHSFGGDVTIGSESGLVNWNLQTCNMTVGGDFSVSPQWTVDAGTSVVSLVATDGGASVSGDFAVNRIAFTANKTYTFTAGDTLTVGAYTAGDWDGTAGQLVTMVSSSPGTQWGLVAPAGVVVSYVHVTDSNNTGTEIDASDGTSTDGDGNTNWLFSSVAGGGGSPFETLAMGIHQGCI